jgi:LacI family transcriptional regulator
MRQTSSMAERQSVTMKDIAHRAGVSTMTVSAVLGGNSVHVRVSDATRERVLTVARALRYRPNPVARALRSQRTNVIGYYSGYGYLDARNPFLSEIIGGLQEGCDEHQKDLLLHGVFGSRSPDDIYAELADGRIDGLVVMAPPDDPLVGRLAGSALPVVVVVDAVPALPSVVADDARGIHLMMDYLVLQGYRRFVYREWDRSLDSVNRRIATFRAYVERWGLDATEWVAPQHTEPGDPTVKSWLTMPAPERPTAFVCWNDMAAYDLLSHCAAHGLRIPDDVAIAGFDGLPTPLGAAYRLTTVRAQWAQVAHTAVSLLAEKLSGKEIPLETVLPVEFIRGNTA